MFRPLVTFAVEWTSNIWIKSCYRRFKNDFTLINALINSLIQSIDLSTEQLVNMNKAKQIKKKFKLNAVLLRMDRIMRVKYTDTCVHDL